MKITNTIIPALLLALTIPLAGDAAAKNYNISGTMDLQNTLPNIAVDPDSGNVLVVWGVENADNADYGRVYAAFGKRKKANKFAFKSPFLVSPDSESHRHPDVVFDPAAGRFLIIWDTWEKESDNETLKTRLLSRFVNRQGAIAGAVKTVLDAGMNEQNPRLCVVPQNTAPSSTTSFFLLWGRYPVGWANREAVGLYSVILDANANKIGQPKRLVQGNWQDDSGGSTGRYWYFGFEVSDIEYNSDGSYVVANYSRGIPPVSDYHNDAYIARFTPDGNLVKQTRLDSDDAYAGRLAVIGANSILTTWYKTDPSNSYMNRMINGSMNPVKTAANTIPGINVNYTDIAKLGKDAGVYQVSSTYNYSAAPGVKKGMLYGQYFKPNGKKKGKPKSLFKHNGYLTWIRAEPIPGTNELFVAWVRWVGDNESQVWGYAFTAK